MKKLLIFFNVFSISILQTAVKPVISSEENKEEKEYKEEIEKYDFIKDLFENRLIKHEARISNQKIFPKRLANLIHKYYHEDSLYQEYDFQNIVKNLIEVPELSSLPPGLPQLIATYRSITKEDWDEYHEKFIDAIHSDIPQAIELFKSGKINLKNFLNLHEILAELFNNIDDNKIILIKLLLENGASACINTPDFYSETLLFKAVEKNIFAVVQILLEYGADANKKNHDDRTVLYLAIWSFVYSGESEMDIRIIELLLKYTNIEKISKIYHYFNEGFRILLF